MSFEDEYRELMAKPIDEIREDIFFRPDNFQDEPWYGDFQMYMAIGVCQPSEEHALQVRKALKVMGLPTHIANRDGKTYGMARPMFFLARHGRSPRNRKQKNTMTGRDRQ